MFLRKIAAPSGGYSVGKSLRFRSSASAYLNRTPASASNRKTWTWSSWVKRGAITSPNCLFAAGGSSTWGQISFTNDGTGNGIDCSFTAGTSAGTRTNAVFRDPSAWYHIVVAVDTTQATDTNRIKIYVNGVQQTFAFTNYPAQNFDTQFNNTVAHRLSANGNTAAAEFFDGYQAETNFIDGQALTPSSFGAYDTNGVWQPAKYTGTYGTNGFYLPFGTTTSTATLGNDSSGNSNTWTVNNISLTAGTTYDSMTDSPTVTSASVANYATFNPISRSYGTVTYSNGNLQAAADANWDACISTIAMTSGKYYFELVSPSAAPSMFVGVQTVGQNYSTINPQNFTGTIVYTGNDGNKKIDGTATAYGTAWGSGDIIGVAVDMDSQSITFYKNNTSQGAISFSSTGVASKTLVVFVAAISNTAIINFGQRPFTYTAPTGFNALNTYNLPTPTIANGAQYMAATLYTGNGSTLAINTGTNTTIGTTFQTDLAWIKSRSAATSHSLMDVLRGYTGPQTSYPRLSSDLTNAEVNNGGISAFTSTGFNLNADAGITNTNGATYVAWSWKANGTGVSNTNGSITSTVSVNTTAGFSILTFNSGTAGNKTVGHGLGVVPAMIITKDRTSANSWTTWHQSLPSATQSYLWLNSTNASANDSRQWANTAPTSSVFSFESGYTFTASDNCVAYCWAAVAGYSAFGSYTGNGAADGPFVYTGFRPRYLLIKASSSTGAWLIDDTSINQYNTTSTVLAAQSSSGDNTGNALDILSNGFKPRDTWVNWNANGVTFIYAAFAENPFNYSRAR
jgi:hypothetical protein